MHDGLLAEKEWAFSADLANDIDQESYLDILSKYTASHPRGTAPKGRPPSERLQQQLKESLINELKRAMKAAADVVGKTLSRNDTYLAEENNQHLKPGKSTGVALCKGGNRRSDAPAPTNHEQDTRREQPIARNSASIVKMSEIEKTKAATLSRPSAPPRTRTGNRGSDGRGYDWHSRTSHTTKSIDISARQMWPECVECCQHLAKNGLSSPKLASSRSRANST